MYCTSPKIRIFFFYFFYLFLFFFILGIGVYCGVLVLKNLIYFFYVGLFFFYFLIFFFYFFSLFSLNPKPKKKFARVPPRHQKGQKRRFNAPCRQCTLFIVFSFSGLTVQRLAAQNCLRPTQKIQKHGFAGIMLPAKSLSLFVEVSIPNCNKQLASQGLLTTMAQLWSFLLAQNPAAMLHSAAREGLGISIVSMQKLHIFNLAGKHVM